MMGKRVGRTKGQISEIGISFVYCRIILAPESPAPPATSTTAVVDASTPVATTLTTPALFSSHHVLELECPQFKATR